MDNLLNIIVSRSATLFEREHSRFSSCPENINQAEKEVLLKEWRLALDDSGDPGVMSRFLDKSGLGKDFPHKVLAEVICRDSAELPHWALALKKVLQRLKSPEKSTTDISYLNPDCPVPFEDLLVPWVEDFIAGLYENIADGRHLLVDSAIEDLARGLLTTLSSLAGVTLYVDFNTFRSEREPEIKSTQTNTVYRAYIEQMMSGGMVLFFQTYPVLARIISTVAGFWRDASSELCQRLYNDYAALTQQFANNGRLGSVVAIEHSLSDRHRGGRSVHILQFESGIKLVYKPKPLKMEWAYNNLLHWIAEREPRIALKALDVLDRGDYGWVSFAEFSECDTEMAVSQFYFRCGVLLGLMYLLDGVDCNQENLIACGEYPVLVDNETLFHHHVELDEEAIDRVQAAHNARVQLEESVQRTGLLPHWNIGKGPHDVYDNSGIGNFDAQGAVYPQLKFSDINTDHMTLAQQQLPGSNSKRNLPRLKGKVVSVEHHQETMVKGFEQTYHFFMKNRDELLAADGPLAFFQNASVRFVFRATNIYSALVKYLQQPQFLSDGRIYSATLERIARAHLLSSKSSGWPILEAERNALYQCDIPFFWASTTESNIYLDSEKAVENFFLEPSYTTVCRRIADMDENTLSFQSQLVRATLKLRFVSYGDEVKTVADERPQEAQSHDQKITANDLLGQACAFGDRLVQQAIQTPDGSLSWIAPSRVPGSQHYQVSQLPLGFYEGFAGIFLFFAALSRGAKLQKDRRRFHELALQTALPIRLCLKDLTYRETLNRHGNLGLGIADGLGGLIYAWVKGAELLSDEQFIEEALLFASFANEATISQDIHLDVCGGCAGFIFGLLALYRASGDSQVLALAEQAGRHLVEKQVRPKPGLSAWPVLGGQLLTGFSHGNAGIALSLLRLYSHTGDRSFHKAALEGIAYENSLFNAEVGNWPYLIKSRDEQESCDEPFARVAWCHGATGIGLSRLGCLAIEDNPLFRDDIQAALQSTLTFMEAGEGFLEMVCCGQSGRIDFLLEAGLRMARSDLLDSARQYALKLQMADKNAFLKRVKLGGAAVYYPGFFLGDAGIGYELLRLSKPDTFSSVLLFD